MTWQGLLAVVGAAATFLGIALFVIACVADSERTLPRDNAEVNRAFNYGLIYGICGMLIAEGLLTAFVGGVAS